MFQENAIKDWTQIAAWTATAIGIIVAIIKYVSEQKQNRQQRELQLEQRKVELRWKQAEAAKKLVDEMLTDELALAAIKMLDWNDLEYEIKPGLRDTINKSDYLSALRTKDLDFSNKEAYIRHCFDSLFGYMAMMEHYIKSELVLVDDIAYPLGYYLKIMDRNREVFINFLSYYELDRTLNLYARLDPRSMDNK